jgi:hypothetical protein
MTPISNRYADMKNMILLIFLITVMASVQVFARKPKKVFFNTDVLVCTDGVKDLVRAEASVLNRNPLDLLPPEDSAGEILATVLSGLSEFAPKRAQFLAAVLKENSSFVEYKSQVEIQRKTEVSTLFVPAGCEVKPLALTTVTREYPHPILRILVNKDLFDQLSNVDKVLAWLSMGFDGEQGVFRLNRVHESLDEDFEFDQVQSRDFLRCWFLQSCRPNTVGGFHQLVDRFHLSYYEQNGILVPARAAIPEDTPVFTQFDSQGRILVARTVIETISLAELGHFFTSAVTFAGKEYSIDQFSAEQSGPIVFDFEQDLFCAPIEGIQGPFLGTIQKWSYSDGRLTHPHSYPLCYNGNGEFLQGYLNLSAPLTFQINGQSLVMKDSEAQYHEYSGNTVIYYRPGVIKWLFRVEGYQPIGQQIVRVRGDVKYWPSGKVECAEIYQDARFLDTSGRTVTFRKEEYNTRMLCFNEAGLVNKEISWSMQGWEQAKGFYHKKYILDSFGFRNTGRSAMCLVDRSFFQIAEQI